MTCQIVGYLKLNEIISSIDVCNAGSIETYPRAKIEGR
jgi:hypothetical protein